MATQSCTTSAYSSTAYSSTAMQHALENSNSKLKEILSTYREYRRFNIAALHEARRFFLGEEHHDVQSLEMKKAVVDYFASQGPVVVLHEGLTSGEVLIDEEHKPYKTNLIERYYDPANANNIYIVGWDASEQCVKACNPIHHFDNAIQSAEKNLSRELGMLESSNLRLDKLLKRQHLTDRIDTLKAKMSQIAPGVVNNNGEIDYNVFMGIEKSKYDLISEQIIPKIVKLSSPLYQSNLEEKISLCVSAQKETMQKINDFMAQTEQARENQFKFMCSSPLEQLAFRSELTRKANPERNGAMCSTLQNLNEIIARLQLPNDVPVIVINGTYHVKTYEEHANDPYYDLSPLYEELGKNHKAVILIPPHLWK